MILILIILNSKYMIYISKCFYGDHKTLHFEVLEKSFKSHQFRFGIILPNLAKITLDKVEKELSADTLKSLDLNSITANVTIPKFKIQSSFDLSDNLQKLGIHHLFLGGKADLSGIEESKSLYVSKVLHKAVVEIDWNGALECSNSRFNFQIGFQTSSSCYQLQS